MKTFRIIQTASGADLGTYQADTAKQALDLLAREAGYRDHAHACAAVPDGGDTLQVVEVQTMDTGRDGR